MAGLLVKNVKLPSVSAIAGVVTAQVISEVFPISAEGSLNFRADIEVTTVTQVGTLTLALQTRSPNGTWTTVASTNGSKTFTAAGTVSIRLNVEVAGDQADMPLQQQARLILTTTDAGDRVTVSAAYVQQTLC